MNIIDKLRDHINGGITREADALYLLAEVRKLLEQQGLKKDYEYLTFHCDWVVHPKLAGPMAQRILKQFDEANIHLKNGLRLHELPNGLNHEIDRISKLRYFEDELSEYLKKNGLPDLSAVRRDGWSHFFHLYTQIVEDCPLVMTAGNGKSVEKVTVHFELGRQQVEDEMLYKMTWTVTDKNGLTGDIFIINGFSATQH